MESYLSEIARGRNSAHGSEGDSFGDGFVPSPEDVRLSFSDELSQTVMFPDAIYQASQGDTSRKGNNDDTVTMSPETRSELYEFVATIASHHSDLPFHNFQRASHATASAHELLNSLCAPSSNERGDFAEEDATSGAAARTFGISADPLARFAMVLSALVHDVDHPGVPNARLVAEADPMAIEYDDVSVVEKRSVALAWEVLVEDRFRGLRSSIFVDGEEMRRFKQLLVNAVLATDVSDEGRSSVGMIEWQRAFHGPDEGSRSSRSLKACLVFQQVAQASNMAHAMQQWETYVKWNTRLYQERAKAYREGRAASDPRVNWHEEGLRFIDRYVIPLTEKLKECGAFGPTAAGGEFLDFAFENRRRWEEEGMETCREMALENDWLVAKTFAATRPINTDFARGCFPY